MESVLPVNNCKIGWRFATSDGSENGLLHVDRTEHVGYILEVHDELLGPGAVVSV